jgi:adenylosuccinate synthase
VLKYSASVNYYTAWNLTKLDVLDTFPTIKVAVAYKDPRDGKELEYFPADLGFLEQCEVVYKEFEGWQTSTTAVKKFEDLPPQAQAYVRFVEQFTGVPVKWIGTGPARDDMIYL